MKSQIYQFFAGIAQKLGINPATIVIETPENPVHGDYTTNVAMVNAGHLKAPPIAIAQKIVDEIKEHQKKSPIPWLARVEIAPPGFINLFLSEATLSSRLMEVLKQKDGYGQARYTSVTQPVTPKNAQKTGVETVGKTLHKISGKKGQNLAQNLPKNSLAGGVVAGKTGKQGKMASFGNKKTYMVEFAHPNTHKAFHIGHLRNISTGESVVRLLESQGNKVIRANYQGDVGMHIAKALYALLNLSPYKDEVGKVKGIKNRVEFLGKAYAAGSKEFEDPSSDGKKATEIIKDLNSLIYASAQRYAREVGRDPGTTDYLALVKTHVHPLDTVYTIWKETRQWSLDYFETVYKRVYTHFDRLYFESECLSGVDRAKDAVTKGVLKVSDGAVIFEGKPYRLDTRVFVNNLNLPTYEGKELALAAMEITEFGSLDRIIHCVGPEQSSFFKVTFKAEELLGIVDPGVQYHLVYGWVRLKKGKMSSRLGNVVLGEWLIDEVKKAIKKILEQSGSKDKEIDQDLILETIAIGAIKYSFLKVSTPSEIAFDLKESINTNGDSGPYLMYAYARCKSVLRKAADAGFKIYDLGFMNENLKSYLLNHKSQSFFNVEERSVARRIVQFPDVVADAAERFAPNVICTYLFQLAQEFNLFYAKHTIIETRDKGLETSKTLPKSPVSSPQSLRLALTAATAQVLKNGLYLLGINTLERM